MAALQTTIDRTDGACYVSTKKAALEWLAVPDKPTGPTITFKQLYDEWSPTHYPSITHKRELILINAFNSCPMLHDEYWRDIGVKEMQAAVKEITPDVATVESLLRVEEG